VVGHERTLETIVLAFQRVKNGRTHVAVTHARRIEYRYGARNEKAVFFEQIESRDVSAVYTFGPGGGVEGYWSEGPQVKWWHSSFR